MRISFKNCLYTLSLLLCLGAFAATAQATVTITPTAVVIEGRNRYADVNLINTSDKETSYEIGWRFYRMTEGTGAYVDVTGPTTAFDLSQYLIYSPRRVTLTPGASQKIRLALRLTGEPPEPGDYRAHLELKEAEAPPPPPSDDPPADAGDTAQDGRKKISVGIGVSVGFSIPVVYRVGEAPVTATIGTVTRAVNPRTGRIELSIPVTRAEGPYGIVGHLQVFYTAPGGQETIVGEVKNANIFPEINARTFTVPIRVDNLNGGSLRVVLRDADRKKDIVFAETTIPVQPQ